MSHSAASCSTSFPLSTGTPSFSGFLVSEKFLKPPSSGLGASSLARNTSGAMTCLEHGLTWHRCFLARWVTPIFVAFDIAALFLQLVGAVMIAGTSITDPNYLDKVHKGKYIALAGVSVQILAFGLFSIIAVRFHIVAKRFKADVERRLRPVPGEKFVTVEGIEGRKLRPNWEMLLYAVNISCALIMVSKKKDSDWHLEQGRTLRRRVAKIQEIRIVR